LFEDGCLIIAISLVGFGNTINSTVLLLDGPFIPVTVLNVKPVIVAVPPGVVTLILPDAPVPITAVIVVAELTINELAATPPKLTAVDPEKFVPVKVMDVPTPPLVGVNDVIVGVGINVNPANVAVPPGVVTLTLPVAPIPTTAVILVAELTVNEFAATPPKLTAVAPLKFVPVIVIELAVPPLVGVNEVIVGIGINVKPASDAVPPGVVTPTLPDAPVPTTAVTLVAELTVNEDAVTPPKFTTVAPAKKLVPVIVIVVPSPPLVGANEVIVGGGINAKPSFDPIPPGVVTVTLPDAPGPTMAVMLVGELTVNDDAAIPPKFTSVVPVKFVPVIVIAVPIAPLDGLNEVIVGGEINVKPANVAVPPGVVTLTLPAAPMPTTAVILVPELTVNEEAATPPKLTAVAPAKFVPDIVIDVPAAPLVGVNDVIVGAGINVNAANVAVPLVVITVTLPDAPVPTTAVILVDELTVKDEAATPPILTEVAPVRLVPVIVIIAPGPPLVGVNEVIVGGGVEAGLVTTVPVTFVLTGKLKSK